MSGEDQNTEFKSLRLLTRDKPDWAELARDCVGFANARGGRILIGIEDGADEPAAGQQVPQDVAANIYKRIGELTVNVAVAVQIKTSSASGGQFVELTVSRSASPASTTDGRFYLRVADQCKPLIGEQVQRLLDERNAAPWETLTTLHVRREQADRAKASAFTAAIRASSRVKPSVKEKSDAELLDHYCLADGPYLTNLGVLCVGRREDRARLGSAPIIQFIKYDEQERKVNKISWDDHTLSPIELIEAVWREVPDFRETFELPHGMFRRQSPIYDERVVRELLVNALVHRPYTQRGDIFLNLHPDRLQIVNPGLLPLGVTPQNILHQSVRRNDEMGRVFHDLGLMEREGSGYDMLYEILTSQGRALPVVREGPDRVEVTIPRRVVKPEVVDFLARADEALSPTQRERIALGILVQHDGLTARQLASVLELPNARAVAAWLERLLTWEIVRQTGRTRGTRYFIDPVVLRTLEFPSKTTLARLEPHRLRELILEDLRRYPGSAYGEIQARIGSEIPVNQVRWQLKSLLDEGYVKSEGEKRWRKYSIA